MKLNAAFLARLRKLKRTVGEASLPGMRNATGGLNLPKFGNAGELAAPPLPAFVTDLLSQLGVTAPGTATARKPAPLDPATDKETVSPGLPGEFISRSFSCEAGARQYKLYIPQAYNGRPLPLLVMLHGCTQSPDDFAAGTRANTIADELHCFVAYPAQTSSANSSRCWNWFEPADQQADAGEPAVLAGITRQIMSDYAIDEARVFVAGLSAGGAMAAILGAAYPTLFAAVGVHSGLPVGAAHDLSTALATMRDGGKRSGASPASHAGAGDGIAPPPMIIFQGDEDKTVHPRNAEALLAQSVAGRLSQTVEEEVKAGSGRACIRTLVLDAEGESIAELWLIHHAGHAWAGGDAAGSYTDPKGPDATREMMKFFLAHPKRSGFMQRVGESLGLLHD